MNQGINEILIEFVNTMIQTFPKDDLVLLNNNLKKLNIVTRSFKLSNVLKHENTGAQWIPEKNRIEISLQNYRNTINHELLHVASTYISDNNMIHCGFYKYLNEHSNIGESINEGYTQYLAEKYFTKYPILKAYTYEKQIASAIELIIGRKLMQKLYFNADLNGLVLSLENFESIDNIYTFLNKMDYVTKTKKDKRIISVLKEINYFVISMYLRKVMKENKDIDIKDLIKRMLPLIMVLPSQMTIDKVAYKINDDNEVFSIINNVYNEFQNKSTKNYKK